MGAKYLKMRSILKNDDISDLVLLDLSMKMQENI